MTHIILQPAGGPHGRPHYMNTIETPVPQSVIESRLPPEEVAALSRIYGGASIPTWGVVPGVSDVNVKKWSRIEPGDITLFSRDNAFISSGTVTRVLHHAALADQLWGRDDNDQIWEYIYFLDEVRPQSITYSSFNIAVGYKTNNVVQGFSVLTERQSADVLAAFDLDSRLYEPDVSDDEFEAVLSNLELDPEEPLDAVGRVKLRKEQAKLRRALFGGERVSVCGICGRSLPVDLLVAAHIKKRSRCTSDERRDAANVVMAMCKLGCDELFERGYLGVEDGKVVVATSSSSASPDLVVVAEQLSGRLVDAWTSASEPYFSWHRSFSFRG
jgi:hypothetical protein